MTTTTSIDEYQTIKLYLEEQPVSNTKSRLRYKLFNLLSTTIIIIVIPFMYYGGFISQDWVNRIGIVLNFVAAFLISPELLVRTDVLNKAEQKLRISTRKVHRLTELLQLQTNRIYKFFLQDNDASSPNIFASIGFGIILIAIFTNLGISGLLPYTIVIYTITTPIVVFDVVREIIRGNRKRISLARYAIVFIIMPLLFPIFVFVHPLLFLVLSVLKVLGFFGQYLFDVLIGDGRLRSILVWWGIISFLVGNILQFAATF